MLILIYFIFLKIRFNFSQIKNYILKSIFVFKATFNLFFLQVNFSLLHIIVIDITNHFRPLLANTATIQPLLLIIDFLII